MSCTSMLLSATSTRPMLSSNPVTIFCCGARPLLYFGSSSCRQHHHTAQGCSLSRAQLFAHTECKKSKVSTSFQSQASACGRSPQTLPICQPVAPTAHSQPHTVRGMSLQLCCFTACHGLPFQVPIPHTKAHWKPPRHPLGISGGQTFAAKPLLQQQQQPQPRQQQH